MPVIPTQVAENSYILSPWVVGNSIFGLFVLRDRQIDLHPKASTHTCWSVTVMECSCCWAHGALITASIRTSPCGRGWATWRISRNPWCYLLLVLSTMSNDKLIVGVVGPSHFPIGCSLIQTLHPIIYFAGTSQRSDGSPWPSGVSWLSGHHPLLHHSICDSPTAFLNSIYHCFHLCQSPSPLTGPVKLNLMSLALPKGSPLYVIIFQRTI